MDAHTVSCPPLLKFRSPLLRGFPETPRNPLATPFNSIVGLKILLYRICTKINNQKLTVMRDKLTSEVYEPQISTFCRISIIYERVYLYWLTD